MSFGTADAASRSWRSGQFLYTSMQVTQWTFAALRLVLLLASLLLLSWMINYNPVSWDLRENRAFSLSEQSKIALDGLQEPIQLTVFVAGGQEAGLQRTLHAYSEYSPLAQVRLVDPQAEPLLAESYEVKDYGVLIVDAGDRIQRVETIEEPQITNAILAVSRGEPVAICFLAGHGERNWNDKERGGLSHAAEVLRQTNYDPVPIVLASQPDVPGECRVVIVAGPENDLLPSERQALRRYLESGGRALILAESGDAVPEIAGLLDDYGLLLHDDVIIDTAKNAQAMGLGLEVPLVDRYEAHPITESFRLMSLYPTSRSITVAESVPPELEVRVLATSTRSSWGETELGSGRAARWDEGEELAGPLPLVIAVAAAVKETPSARQLRLRRGEPELTGDPIMVVFGDIDFASNAYFNFQGNGDLFLNSVSWLSGQTELISIRPKDPLNKRVTLTNFRRFMVFLIVIMLLPLSSTIVRFVIYFNYRK